MKKHRKLGWYLFGILVMSLALLAFSCGGTTTSTEEQDEEEGKQEEVIDDTAEVEEDITVATPMAIPHTLAGRDDCQQCHGESGIKPFPANHAGRSNTTCTGCHDAPEDTAAETGAIPQIPHTLDGRDDCLMCHSETGLKPFPADHAGRPNNICQGCHQPT